MYLIATTTSFGLTSRKGEIVKWTTCSEFSTNQNAAKFEITYNALVRIYCFYLQGWRFFSRFNRGYCSKAPIPRNIIQR